MFPNCQPRGCNRRSLTSWISNLRGLQITAPGTQLTSHVLLPGESSLLRWQPWQDVRKRLFVTCNIVPVLLSNIGLTGKQASSSSSSSSLQQLANVMPAPVSESSLQRLLVLPLTLRLRRRHPLLSSLSLPIFGDIFALSRVWLVILPLLFVFFISLVSTPHCRVLLLL
jgi:hypothetical protein